MNVQFKFSVKGDCYMKIQNDVFWKGQDYNTVMLRQGKRQRVES